MCRKPKYCTKYYGAATHNNPAAQSSIERGRLDRNIPKLKTNQFRATLSCVPAVPKLHRRSLGSETTCRAVAARGFSFTFRPQISCRLRGRAYSAARSFSCGGPFTGAGRRSLAFGNRRSLGRFALDTRHGTQELTQTVHQEKNHHRTRDGHLHPVAVHPGQIRKCIQK